MCTIPPDPDLGRPDLVTRVHLRRPVSISGIRLPFTADTTSYPSLKSFLSSRDSDQLPVIISISAAQPLIKTSTARPVCKLCPEVHAPSIDKLIQCEA